MVKSIINPKLTLEYMTTVAENKYFDRKSSKIKPSDLATLISAFANAEGGTIAIGISDKTKRIEGLHQCDENKINLFLNAAKDGCVPMPKYEEEFINVINDIGARDRILLLHISASTEQIISVSNGSVYLRIGDKTRELKGEDLKNLEYAKGNRHYEDECSMDAELSDLDEALIEEYKERLDAKDLSIEQILKARGFIKKINGIEKLTNGAVLLFAKNIQQFYPNCRIRFVRYDGNFAKTGTSINVIKDKNIEDCVLKIINEAKAFIGSQLRDFTALNHDGKFQIVPEYPEFAWLEGIVNAVTHREYGMSGNFITVYMYDDRLEIKSPGKLPSIVTVDNIKDTRYSRNPRIARVLTEFGWVRELNEGVKRIYADMEEFFLDDPVYSEPEQSVKLVLKNNIVMRTIRATSRVQANISTDLWNQLDDMEKDILTYMSSRKCITRVELEQYTGRSSRTVTVRLNNLMNKGIIKRNGNLYDPKQTYELILNENM